MYQLEFFFFFGLKCIGQYGLCVVKILMYFSYEVIGILVLFLYDTQIDEDSCYRGKFWLLSPKDEWVKAQRATHNGFVKSRLKSQTSMNQALRTMDQKILRQQRKTGVKQGNPFSAKSEENDSSIQFFWIWIQFQLLLLQCVLYRFFRSPPPGGSLTLYTSF